MQIPLCSTILSTSPYYKWSGVPKRNKPAAICADLHEESDVADELVSDTAALSPLCQNVSSSKGYTFSTILDSHGGVFAKARESAQALGYISAASAVTLHVDADRHCSLQELVRRREGFADCVRDFQNLEDLPTSQKDAHWISEPVMYQLLMECRQPVANRWSAG